MGSCPEGYLIFRADSDSRMGIGHVMRCSALAQACQATGGRALFLSRCTSEPLRWRLKAAGIGFMPLEQAHPKAADLDRTLVVLAELRANWLVADGYHFDPAYQRAVRAAGHRLLVIDDLAHWPHYHADIVLNQNINADSLGYECDPDTRLLLGTRYALLRSEFLAWRGRPRAIPDVGSKVLVTMGGSDPDNVTLKVIQALRRLKIPGLAARVVVGPANPHLKALRRSIQEADYSLELLTNVSEMPELMAWSDLAVTAGGSICWELAFMGLPGLIIILADNQLAVGQRLEQSGIGVNLGWHASLSPEHIAQSALRLLASPEIRGKMALKGQTLVDGEGTGRVMMLVRGHALRLRRVQDDDCHLLWEWANDVEVREAAFSTAAIPWMDHKRWFIKKRNDPHCLQLIAVDDQDQPVGQVRFDIKEGESAEINVSVDRQRRGLGYGKLILELATEEFFRSTPVRTINAFIKIGNIKSIRAFEKAQYMRVGPLTKQREPSVLYVRKRDDAS